MCLVPVLFDELFQVACVDEPRYTIPKYHICTDVTASHRITYLLLYRLDLSARRTRREEPSIESLLPMPSLISSSSLEEIEIHVHVRPHVHSFTGSSSQTEVVPFSCHGY